MTDGQNLFDKESTEYGSWNVIPAVEKQKDTGFSAVIVGIDNGNIYRDSELTPKCIGEIQHRDYFNDIFSPEGEVFDSFLTDTFIPYIENNFPVKKNKAFRYAEVHRAVCRLSLREWSTATSLDL